MELIIMLLAPFPIGFFIRNRMAAYLAYVAPHSFVFTFQSTTLLKEWNGWQSSMVRGRRVRAGVAFAGVGRPAPAPWQAAPAGAGSVQLVWLEPCGEVA
jgi:hypothetical protein